MLTCENAIYWLNVEHLNSVLDVATDQGTKDVSDSDTMSMYIRALISVHSFFNEQDP